MKIFISQHMNGKTNAEIIGERNRIINNIEKILKTDNIEYIYSIINTSSFPHGESIRIFPVWYLSKSIEQLSKADLVVFGLGWEKARGCCIEHAICKEYGIKTMESI